MAKFDKSGMKFQLTDVNDSMTGRKYVPYDKIVPNKLNADLSQEDIETLMYSITEPLTGISRSLLFFAFMTWRMFLSISTSFIRSPRVSEIRRPHPYCTRRIAG